MKPQGLTQAFTFLHAFLSLVNGVPVRRENNPPFRGSEALAGYSPSEQVASGPPPDIEYKLVPGQKKNADIGSYLNFVNADNPQPIRGTYGGDDPGPSRFQA